MQSERERLAAQLESIAGALNAFRKSEAEHSRKLDSMRDEHESVAAELAELEEAANRKV